MATLPCIRLANLAKRCLNLRGKSVRSLAYTTCSDVSDCSSDAGEPLGKFKVTKKRKKEGGSAALLFGRQLKEFGFKHDVETYMAIVRLLLSHSGMEVRLYNLFMHVIENENNVGGLKMCRLLEALIEEKLIKAVQVLVKLYASVGRVEEAIHIVSEMESRSGGGVMVSAQTCNFIMKEMIERDKVDKLDFVYRQLQGDGLIPNVYTLGILIKGHARQGRLIETVDLLNQMEVDVNDFIIGSYIHGFCSIGQTDVAFELVKKLRESSHPVDVFAYTCVIGGFVNELKLQDAEDVFLEMKKLRVVPDADCYGALIRAYFQRGDTAKARDLCKEMESRGIRPDYVIVSSLMQDMRRFGMLSQLVDKFKGFMQQSRPRVFLDGDLFNMAIDAACKLGRMDDAMGLMKRMKSRKLKPRKMHYRTLMRGFCFRGEPWNAIHMFQEMMRNGFTPHSADYHLLACSGVSLPFYMLFK